MASLFPKLITPPADITLIVKSLQGMRNAEELARNKPAAAVLGQIVTLLSHLGVNAKPAAKKAAKPDLTKRVKGEAVSGSADGHSFEAVIGKVGGKPVVSRIMVWKGEAKPGNLVADFSKGAMLKGEADPLSALLAEFSKQYPQLSAPLSKQGEEEDAEMAEDEAGETAEGETEEGEAASDGDTIHAVIFALAEMLATAGDPLATQVLAAYDPGEGEEAAEEEAEEMPDEEAAELEGQDDEAADGELEEEPRKAARATMHKGLRVRLTTEINDEGGETGVVIDAGTVVDVESGRPGGELLIRVPDSDDVLPVQPDEYEIVKAARATMRKALVSGGYAAAKYLVDATGAIQKAQMQISGEDMPPEINQDLETARTAIQAARTSILAQVDARKGARPQTRKGADMKSSILRGTVRMAKAQAGKTSVITEGQSGKRDGKSNYKLVQRLNRQEVVLDEGNGPELFVARPDGVAGWAVVVDGVPYEFVRGNYTGKAARAPMGKLLDSDILGRVVDALDEQGLEHEVIGGAGKMRVVGASLAQATNAIPKDDRDKFKVTRDGSDAIIDWSANKAARPGMRKAEGRLLNESEVGTVRRVLRDNGLGVLRAKPRDTHQGNTFDVKGVPDDPKAVANAVIDALGGKAAATFYPAAMGNKGGSTLLVAVITEDDSVEEGKAAKPRMKKGAQNKIVRGSLEVVEASNGYELYGTSPDGKEVHIASLGDGVDMFFDEDGEPIDAGTPEFDAAAKAMLKNPSDLEDAYDFELVDAKAARPTTRKAARPARRPIKKAGDDEGENDEDLGEFEDGYRKDGETVVIDPDADMDDVAYTLVMDGWEDERADEASDMGWSYSLVVADFRVAGTDDEYGGFIYAENKNSGNKEVSWFDSADEARAKWKEVEADVASEDGQMIRDNNADISKEFEAWFEKHPGSEPQDAVDAIGDKIGDDYGTGTSDSAVAAMLEIATEVYDEGGYAAGADEGDDDVEAAARIGSLRKAAAIEPNPAARQAYEAEIARLEDGVAVQKSGGPDVRVRKFSGFSVGDDVLHKSFGKGRVMALETGQAGRQVSVIFSDPDKGNILGPINIDPNKLKRGK